MYVVEPDLVLAGIVKPALEPEFFLPVGEDRHGTLLDALAGDLEGGTELGVGRVPCWRR